MKYSSKLKILSYTTTYMLYLLIRRNEVFFDEIKFFFQRNEFDQMKFDQMNSTKRYLLIKLIIYVQQLNISLLI